MGKNCTVSFRSQVAEVIVKIEFASHRLAGIDIKLEAENNLVINLLKLTENSKNVSDDRYVAKIKFEIKQVVDAARKK